MLNAVAPARDTYADFVRTFAQSLHRPWLLPSIPAFVVEAMFGPERARLVTTGQIVQPTAALKSGYKFKYGTLAAACAECARVRLTDEEKMRLTSVTDVTRPIEVT